MRIGFDLDKIFINTPPFIPNSLIERMYKKKSNGTLLYNIPSYRNQLIRRITHLPLFRPPIKENLSFLTQVAQKNNDLYLISSRFGFLEGRTTKLIKKYKLDKFFSGMYFNFDNKQPHLFKTEVIKNLNLDVYVDDDLALIQYVAKRTPKTMFFWFNPKGQKQDIATNVFAINKLSDIVTFLQGSKKTI